MADILEILLEILEDLSPDELDRFKLHLTKTVLDGFKPIPKGKLGTNVTQLVQIMERFYKDQGSIDITLHILKKMDLSDLEVKLQQKIQDLPNKSGPSPGQDQKQASSAGNDLNFFNKHKAELETRMSIRPVLIELEGCGILNAMERETVEVESTSYKQNHALIVLLSRKGSGAQEKFYKILKEKDRYLVEDLEK